MDLYYRQEVRVGVLVLVAFVVFVVGLLWLTGQSLGGRGEMPVLARFENVKGLSVGDPVQISGVGVGRVADIRLEGVSNVLVRLAVSDDRRPRADARAAVRSLDLMGSRYIEYDPGTANEPLPEGEIIEGARETELTATATAIGDRAAEFLLRSQELLVEDVRPTLRSVQRSLDVMARLAEGPLVTEARGALVALRQVGERLDSTLSNPAIDQSISQMDEIAESLREMSEGLAATTQALGQILEKVDNNQGTLGRLVNDTTLATDLHGVLDEMRLLLADLRERPGRYMPRNFKVFE